MLQKEETVAAPDPKQTTLSLCYPRGRKAQHRASCSHSGYIILSELPWRSQMPERDIRQEAVLALRFRQCNDLLEVGGMTNAGLQSLSRD